MKIFPSILRSFRRFLDAQEGFAATEFALIAPLMITLYFGTTEISDALAANSKVTSMASSAADLVAQADTIHDGDIADVFAALNAIMFPYNKADTKIVISSLIDAGSGNAKVDWSDAQNATARTKGTFVTVPSGLVASGGSVILAEVTYNYSSPAGKMIYGTIPFKDSFYLRPRKVPQIARSP